MHSTTSTAPRTRRLGLSGPARRASGARPDAGGAGVRGPAPRLHGGARRRRLPHVCRQRLHGVGAAVLGHRRLAVRRQQRRRHDRRRAVLRQDPAHPERGRHAGGHGQPRLHLEPHVPDVGPGARGLDQLPDRDDRRGRRHHRRQRLVLLPLRGHDEGGDLPRAGLPPAGGRGERHHPEQRLVAVGHRARHDGSHRGSDRRVRRAQRRPRRRRAQGQARGGRPERLYVASLGAVALSRHRDHHAAPVRSGAVDRRERRQRRLRTRCAGRFGLRRAAPECDLAVGRIELHRQPRGRERRARRRRDDAARRSRRSHRLAARRGSQAELGRRDRCHRGDRVLRLPLDRRAAGQRLHGHAGLGRDGDERHRVHGLRPDEWHDVPLPRACRRRRHQRRPALRDRRRDAGRHGTRPRHRLRGRAGRRRGRSELDQPDRLRLRRSEDHSQAGRPSR